ncbi:collagen alpha-1(I) chain-like [Heterocephalus glaber]|uniref:Collagen alpha-1(I) chain-like n=1 Tax=Heterocephalus glaber TaxID=10181 RepID=A0AAX6SNF5_HETGA|nr:collagen alpha-1(I) chain-like [Heterocephalus glaber]
MALRSEPGGCGVTACDGLPRRTSGPTFCRTCPRDSSSDGGAQSLRAAAWRSDLGPEELAGALGRHLAGGCGADPRALLSPAPVLRRAECSGLWRRSGELQGEGRRGLRGRRGEALDTGRERRGRCPCDQCWMRGPSAGAAPGSRAPRGGRLQQDRGGSHPRHPERGLPLAWHTAGRRGVRASVWQRAGTPGGPQRPRSRTRALGPAARQAAPAAAPRGSSRRCLSGRLRIAGAGASAAAGGERRAEAWARGRPEGGKEEGGEKGGRGGPGGGGGERERDSERREGASERGRQAGREGGGARAAAARAEDEPGRGAAAPGRAAGPARPERPHGNERRCGGREAGPGGRGAGRRLWAPWRAVPGSARGALPDPLQLGARRPRGRGCGRRRQAELAGRRADPRVCLCPRGLGRRPLPSRPLPARTPLPAPARPRAQVQVYTMLRGPLRRPPCSAQRWRRGPARPPSPSGLCSRLGALSGARGRGAGGRRPQPGIFGPRRGPEERGGGGGRAPGPAQAPRRRQKMAAWHDPAPRPSPGSQPSSAPRGGVPGRPPEAGRGVIRGPGRGALRSDPPPATCGWGCGAPADLGGAAREEGAHSWGTSSRGGPGRGWGGCRGRLLPAPAAAVGARAVVAVAAPQCGGGAGAGEDPGPWGRKTRGWEQRAGNGAGGDAGVVPCSSPPPAHTHARGHTHAHAPRRAGADVSLKASHLHSEGRGLAEATDGVYGPTSPRPRRPRASEPKAAAVRVPPSPRIPTPDRPGLPPLRRGLSWLASRARPQPLFAGARRPRAAELRFAFLEPAFLGAPSPFSPPLCCFPLFSIHSVLAHSLLQGEWCWHPGWEWGAPGSQGLPPRAPKGSPLWLHLDPRWRSAPSWAAQACVSQGRKGWSLELHKVPPLKRQPQEPAAKRPLPCDPARPLLPA